MNSGYLSRKLARLNTLVAEAQLRLGRVAGLRAKFDNHPLEPQFETTLLGLQEHLDHLRETQLEVQAAIATADAPSEPSFHIHAMPPPRRFVGPTQAPPKSSQG